MLVSPRADKARPTECRMSPSRPVVERAAVGGVFLARLVMSEQFRHREGDLPNLSPVDVLKELQYDRVDLLWPFFRRRVAETGHFDDIAHISEGCFSELKACPCRSIPNTGLADRSRSPVTNSAGCCTVAPVRNDVFSQPLSIAAYQLLAGWMPVRVNWLT
jgi:hypothetical protein